MKEAAFHLTNYRFDKVYIDMDHYEEKERVNVRIEPSGIFNKKTKSYHLTMNFGAYLSKESEDPFAALRGIGDYQFENVTKLEDIPEYFWNNSIAIIFPYIRAYVSIMVNQANLPPLLLPTMNLSDLAKPLKESTIEVEAE